MTSRTAAAVVLVAGIAILTWALLRSDPAAESTLATVPAAAANETTADPNPDTPAEQADETASPSQPTETEPVAADPEPQADQPENFGPRLSFTNLDGWLNTDTIDSLDDLDGQVFMVEMWTFGCSNCKARIPYNQAYYEEFRDQGFEIVGLHAPEFSYEADLANIEQALIDLGVTWPVALDTDKKNFRRWQEGTTSYWPRTYVIDQNGDIRYDHIGEGKYEELHETIAYLLDNPPPPASS